MAEKDVNHFTDSIIHEIIKTAIYSRVKGSQYFNKFNIGITFEQYLALDTISFNPDICQRDLSKLILKDRSNTGRILNILEENGFIERTVETKQNRLVKNMKVTEKGQKILDDNKETMKQDFKKIFELMKEEEFDQLRYLLQKFRKILSQDTTMQI